MWTSGRMSPRTNCWPWHKRRKHGYWNRKQRRVQPGHLFIPGTPQNTSMLHCRHHGQSGRSRRDLSRDLRDWLGPRMDGRPQDARKCNNCGAMGHIARFCTGQIKAPAADVPSNPGRLGLRSDTTHRTDGATCSACKKPGHVEAQCWTTHPERQPQDSLRKRNGAMYSLQAARKRVRAAEHMSPDYHY